MRAHRSVRTPRPIEAAIARSLSGPLATGIDIATEIERARCRARESERGWGGHPRARDPLCARHVGAETALEYILPIAIGDIVSTPTESIDSTH